MDVATITILLLIICGILSLAEWIRIIKNDAGISMAKIHTLETQVEYLQEDLQELRKDEKNIEAIVQKILEEKILNEKRIDSLQQHIK